MLTVIICNMYYSFLLMSKDGLVILNWFLCFCLLMNRRLVPGVNHIRVKYKFRLEICQL